MAKSKKQNKQAPKPNFVLINRSIFDWGWWKDIYVSHLFVSLILLANHNVKVVKGIEINRGQHLTSVKELSFITGMSETAIKTSLKKLKSTGEIVDDVKPNKYRIITIVNYDKFQGIVSRSTTNNATNSKTDNKTNSKTNNATDNATTNNNNISKDILNKEKKVSVVPTGQTDTVKKETSPTAVSPEGEPPAAFDYEKINWSIVQTFKGDDGRDLVYGNIPYKSVGRFSRANGIDDYTASEFYTAFERSKTPFPRNWQKILVRYDKLDSKEQDKFIERLHNGEFREKWKE